MSCENRAHAIDTIQAQRDLCQRHGAEWVSASEDFKVGIARNLRAGAIPISGLRHPIAGYTTGWYLWAGEGDLSTDPDFVKPMRVRHLIDLCPEVVPFLGLAPGWRFLVAGEYVDVWQDLGLLET